MVHFEDYKRPLNLEEAYELNQKKSAKIAGGFCFLRLGDRRFQTLLDLSGLLSAQIIETEEEFVIGAMAPLRALELDRSLNRYMAGAAAGCVRRIVGTQFRNCATVGGSIFGRYGFSDVLTAFLAADSYVDLYKRGRVPLRQFAGEKQDKDIMLSLIVKKKPMRMAYEAMRQEESDFPILTAAVAESEEGKTYVAVGARPARAETASYDGLLSALSGEELEEAAERLAGVFSYGANLRGSAEYRRYLAKVLIARCVRSIQAQREKGAGDRGQSKKGQAEEKQGIRIKGDR